MSKRIYWKILYKRKSCFTTSMFGGIEYIKGQWVRPELEGSKLMVFESKRLAQIFKDSKIVPDDKDFTIVRCHVKGCQSKHLLVANNLFQFDRFWGMINKKESKLTKQRTISKSYIVTTPPPGTVLVDEVFCID